MPRTIISDTSCFIILEKINELDILKHSYDSVFTTSIIAREFGLPLPEWVTIQDPENHEKLIEFESKVDKGEATAIALAIELKDSTLVLDDQKARKFAESLGIEVTGTIGVIVRAKLRGKIPTIKPLLEKMRQTNFRFSNEIEADALAEAGE